jgi:outer membrane protein OmpA-like peptidoglycan-associated protein
MTDLGKQNTLPSEGLPQNRSGRRPDAFGSPEPGFDLDGAANVDPRAGPGEIEALPHGNRASRTQVLNRLQRTHGNHFVQRLLQRQLAILSAPAGPGDDALDSAVEARSGAIGPRESASSVARSALGASAATASKPVQRDAGDAPSLAMPVPTGAPSSTDDAAHQGSLTIDGFALDHADLTPEHKKQLADLAARLAGLLKQYPDSFISIVGHADATGTPDHNQVLGQQRADNVLNELKANSVPAEAMRAGSVGDSVLLVETKGPEPRNRRVDVNFTARQFTQLPAPQSTPPLSGALPPSSGSWAPPIVGPWSSLPSLPSADANNQHAPPGATRGVPPGAVDEVNALTDLIQKTADAAKKDALIKGLRDKLAALQPFMSTPDAKKAIDDGIDALVKEGSNAAIKALLQGITGRSPTTMPDRDHPEPPFPQKDLKEQIFKGPSIPISDTPKAPPRTLFDYRNGPRETYAPGATIAFTVVPPDDFLTLSGSKRVVIVADADRSTPGATKLAQVFLESASPTAVQLTAPSSPGKYVIRVDVGMDIADASAREFEVKATQESP